MRKWIVPLMVLGAGGVGALLFTDKGRGTLHRWIAKLESAPEHWNEWNEGAMAELERIQTAVNQVAKALEPHGNVAR